MSVINRLKELFQPKPSPNRIGISLTNDGVRCAYEANSGKIRVTELTVTDENFLAPFQTLANKEFYGTCSICLPASQYQIVQVDKPNVPDEELSQALKWQVKDLVPFAPEDMVIDYFYGPGNAMSSPKLNVVCANATLIKPLLAKLQSKKLYLKEITVEEFAFAQLLGYSDDGQLLVCQQPNQDVSILIVKQGKVFFYRRLRGLAQIGMRTEDELSFGVIDSLSLEIQRSTDFFERQLKQAPIKSIKVMLPIKHEAFLARKLAENTTAPVELLSMPSEFAEYRSFATVFGLMAGKAEPTDVADEPTAELAGEAQA